MSVGSHVQQNRDSGMINILPSAVHSQALREFGQLVPKAAAGRCRPVEAPGRKHVFRCFPA